MARGWGDSQRAAGPYFAPGLARSSPYQGEDTGGVMTFSCCSKLAEGRQDISPFSEGGRGDLGVGWFSPPFSEGG